MAEELIFPEGTKKIAILGTTPSRFEAPLGDASWEVWTIGPGGREANRWDRLYETHTVWPEDFHEYLNDISKVDEPRKVMSIVPMAERMKHWASRWSGKDPKKFAELMAKIEGDWSSNVVIDREPIFDTYSRMWFSTSICYAIMHVIEDHLDRSRPREDWVHDIAALSQTAVEISVTPCPPEAKTVMGLWGIDLESDEEHISQFIGAKHLLDMARFIGIDIILPSGSGLDRDLNPYPDRYETHLSLTFEKKKKLLTNIRAQCEQELDGQRMMLHRTEGALMKLQEVFQQLIANGQLTDEGKAFIEGQLKAGNEQLPQLQAAFLGLRDRANQLNGEKNSTEYFERMFTWGMFDPGRQL